MKAALILALAAAVPQSDELAARRAGPWGIDLSDGDRAVKPGDDFYRFQNGAWLERTQLGPRQPFAAYWFDLRQLAPRRVNALLMEAAADSGAPASSPRAMAGAFYRSFMNAQLVEQRGLAPLGPELEAIRAADTRAKLARLLGQMAGPGTPRFIDVRTGWSIGRSGPFSVDIRQDQDDPARSAIYVGQSGLNLPGPEYYSDPKLADLKAKYQGYAGAMLGLLGWPDPQAAAAKVVALETRIAGASWTHEQMRNVRSTHNPLTLEQLEQLAPRFDWRSFFAGAELPHVRRVVIDAKSAFPEIARICEETPIEVWQARQAFAVVDDAAASSLLGAAANTAAFDFRFRAFSNPSAVEPPRAARAPAVVARSVGGIVSALYLDRYYPPDVRAAAEAMAENLRRAFDARLERVSWMSAATRAKARAKLAKMTLSMGSPPHLRQYAGLVVRDDDLYGNAQRAAAYEWRARVNGLSRPYDRTQWNVLMMPEFPSYHYEPSSNSVQIPAAMFVAPFFDVQADAAVNYGAIGSMVASMLASGFDNAGRHYDADGRLRDWWTPAEEAAFAEKTRQLSAIYSEVEPLPGIHLKGDLVVDEAIDDLAGMLIALDALHLSLNGKPAPVIDGFTAEQRFFLGRAQMWRAKFDPAFVRNQLATGQNSHPFQRVNGPIRHIDAWYEAFDVRPGDAMFLAPERRLRIW